MTRTEAILRAVRDELEVRRAEIDAEPRLSYLVVEVSLHPGRVRPRKVRLTRKTEREVD